MSYLIFLRMLRTILLSFFQSLIFVTFEKEENDSNFSSMSIGICFSSTLFPNSAASEFEDFRTEKSLSTSIGSLVISFFFPVSLRPFEFPKINFLRVDYLPTTGLGVGQRKESTLERKGFQAFFSSSVQLWLYKSDIQLFYQL